MEVSDLLWKFIHIVNSQSEEDIMKSKSYYEMSKIMSRCTPVWIHTSYLPHLPYEANTYVGFKNMESAFDTLYEMYQKHAIHSEESVAFCRAYRLMVDDVDNLCKICEGLTNLNVSSDVRT